MRKPSGLDERIGAELDERCKATGVVEEEAVEGSKILGQRLERGEVLGGAERSSAVCCVGWALHLRRCCCPG